VDHVSWYFGEQNTRIWPINRLYREKKSAVLAKKGSQIKLVRFGDPNMSIKKDQPARRKSFRARHNCDSAKDKFSARYWSCKAW